MTLRHHAIYWVLDLVLPDDHGRTNSNQQLFPNPAFFLGKPKMPFRNVSTHLSGAPCQAADRRRIAAVTAEIAFERRRIKAYHHAVPIAP